MLSVMMNVTAITLLQNKYQPKKNFDIIPVINDGRHVHVFFSFFPIFSPYVQSNQQEVHRIETIRQREKREKETREANDD